MWNVCLCPELTSGEDSNGRSFVGGHVILIAGTACTPNRISDSRIRLGAIVTEQKRSRRITGGDECRQESGHILPFRLVVVVIEIFTWHRCRHRNIYSHAVVLASTRHWGIGGRRWWSLVIKIHYIFLFGLRRWICSIRLCQVSQWHSAELFLRSLWMVPQWWLRVGNISHFKEQFGCNLLSLQSHFDSLLQSQ